MTLSKDYIAGLIDGEGYIGLWKASGGRYQVGIKVGMVESDHLLQALKEQYGGYIEHRKSKQPNHRDSTTWSLRNSTQVIPFLNDIMPRLHLKNKQAELLLEYCNMMPIYRKHHTKNVKRSDEIYREMRNLKHGVTRND